jgi:hypothetical protein
MTAQMDPRITPRFRRECEAISRLEVSSFAYRRTIQYLKAAAFRAGVQVHRGPVSDYLNEGKKADVRTIQDTLRHENPEHDPCEVHRVQFGIPACCTGRDGERGSGRFRAGTVRTWVKTWVGQSG